MRQMCRRLSKIHGSSHVNQRFKLALQFFRVLSLSFSRAFHQRLQQRVFQTSTIIAMFEGNNNNVLVVTTVVAATAIAGYLVYKRLHGECPFSTCCKTSTNKTKKKKGPITLEDPEKKYALKLVERIEISADTRHFKFALPSEKHVLGLPIGQHVYLSAKIDGKLVVRPYTPVSSDDDLGYVEFVVKVYFAGVNAKFPEGGKMTQYLENLNIGDVIDVRGPSGLIIYEGNSIFAIKSDKKTEAVKRKFTHIGMIAGGSGITPMLQVIKEMLKHAEDATTIALLFANQTPSDVLLKADLDGLATEHADRFKVWYTVDRATTNWAYSTGHISEAMIQEHLPPPGPETAILMCGPLPMITFACTPALNNLNHSTNNRFTF